MWGWLSLNLRRNPDSKPSCPTSSQRRIPHIISQPLLECPPSQERTHDLQSLHVLVSSWIISITGKPLPPDALHLLLFRLHLSVPKATEKALLPLWQQFRYCSQECSHDSNSPLRDKYSPLCQPWMWCEQFAGTAHEKAVLSFSSLASFLSVLFLPSFHSSILSLSFLKRNFSKHLLWKWQGEGVRVLAAQSCFSWVLAPPAAAASPRLPLLQRELKLSTARLVSISPKTQTWAVFLFPRRYVWHHILTSE